VVGKNPFETDRQCLAENATFDETTFPFAFATTRNFLLQFCNSTAKNAKIVVLDALAIRTN